MRNRSTAGAIAFTATITTLAAATMAAPASAAAGSGGSGVSVIAKNLDGPWGLQALGRHGFLTAENASGQVTRVGWGGRQHTIIRNVAGVAGVAAGRHHVFGVLGGPDETGQAPPSRFSTSSVFRSGWRGHHVKKIADLLKYELRHNPDGQKQFDKNGKPFDSVSNPFSMNLSKYGLLVADGGANDVLRVNPRTGHVSTFFVPKTTTDTPECRKPDANANPGVKGCDPVPTGIAVARGSVYVSTLGALAPGAGRVYKLNPWSGRVQRVWKGLTAPTGVAVASNGTIYTSHVEGAGTDPKKPGTITRIWHGKRTSADVLMPIGLDYQGGHLYATSGALAGPGMGQIVKVGRSAFH
jgi:hypothetical protein